MNDDEEFTTQLDMPPALTAHRWGRVYPTHIVRGLDVLQRTLDSVGREFQQSADKVLLEIEGAYTKGYQDGLAAAAALAAKEQNGG